MFIYNFSGDTQRFLKLEAALQAGLAKGLALYSPDDLTYFIKGKVSGENYDSLSQSLSLHYNNDKNYLLSTQLLMEYRLFASYRGLNFLAEAAMQVCLAILNFGYEALRLIPILFVATLNFVGVILSIVPFVFGSKLGDAFKYSAPAICCSLIETVNQLLKIIPAAALFVAGIAGVATRMIASGVRYIQEPDLTQDNPSDETIANISNQLGGMDSEKVRCSISSQSERIGFFRKHSTALEKMVGSPVQFVPEIGPLFNFRDIDEHSRGRVYHDDGLNGGSSCYS